MYIETIRSSVVMEREGFLCFCQGKYILIVALHNSEVLSELKSN